VLNLHQLILFAQSGIDVTASITEAVLRSFGAYYQCSQARGLDKIFGPARTESKCWDFVKDFVDFICVMKEMETIPIKSTDAQPKYLHKARDMDTTRFISFF
jgi:hypothetical protein